MRAYEEDKSYAMDRSLLEDVSEDRVTVTVTPNFAGFARFGAAQ
jgi:hypothetical protein